MSLKEDALKYQRFILPGDDKHYIVWFKPDKIDYEALKEEAYGRTEWWLYPSPSDPFPKLDRSLGLPAVIDGKRCEWWKNGKHERTLWSRGNGVFLQTEPTKDSEKFIQHNGDITFCHGHKHEPKYPGSVLIDKSAKTYPDYTGDLLKSGIQEMIPDETVKVMRFVHAPVHIFNDARFVPLLNKLQIGGTIIIDYSTCKSGRWKTDILRTPRVRVWEPPKRLSVSGKKLWESIVNAWKEKGFNLEVYNMDRKYFIERCE